MIVLQKRSGEEVGALLIGMLAAMSEEDRKKALDVLRKDFCVDCGAAGETCKCICHCKE